MDFSFKAVEEKVIYIVSVVGRVKGKRSGVAKYKIGKKAKFLKILSNENNI